MGDAPTVSLTTANDLTALIPVLFAKEVPAEVVYNGPISAPITRGDELAELILSPEGLPETRVPLVAGESVNKGGFMVTITTALDRLLTDIGGNRFDAAPEDAAREDATPVEEAS